MHLTLSNFVDDVIYSYSEQGTNINYQDAEGKTVLHHILGKYMGFTDDAILVEIQKLINAGVDVNVKDKNGNTPLISRYIAVNYLLYQEDLVKLFLENKADIMSDIFIREGKSKIPFLYHVTETCASEEIIKLFLEHIEDLIGKKDDILKYLNENKVIAKFPKNDVVDYLNEKIKKEKMFLSTNEQNFSI